MGKLKKGFSCIPTNVCVCFYRSLEKLLSRNQFKPNCQHARETQDTFRKEEECE